MSEDTVYTISEFADLMNVSVKSLQRWDKSGLLVADRLDGYHRSYTQQHVDALNRLIEENSSALTRKKNFKYDDLSGKTFGQLYVIERADDWIGPNGHRQICWKCRCNACGKETVVKGTGLRAGYNKSCGCLQYGDSETKKMWDEYCELKAKNFVPQPPQKGRVGRPAGFKGGNTQFQDLSGRDFGFWHVIERAETKKYARGQVIYWKCRCQCGTIKSVPGRDLRSGGSQSCGCMSKISLLEYFVRQYLDEHGFTYVYQKAYSDLLGTGGKPLVYDFVVLRDEQPICVIECQGEQHYRPIKKFGGPEKLIRQQIHDALKRNYAKDMLQVPLFEVMYTCMSKDSVYDACDSFLLDKL